MQYFLAVDAGGTKTDFVLGDEHRELAGVSAGTIKRMKADAEITEANLNWALEQLTAATGISMQSITRCCIGTAGETVPLVVDWLRQAFGRYVGGELILLGDVEIALDAAFFGKRGVLVLAGTGSNVAGRAACGNIVTAGGWGPAIADQGSGHFIGLEALRRGFLAIDQQRSTRLLEMVQAYLHLASVGELIEYANANPAPNFSELAPLVVTCAEEGDLVAQEVLQQSGEELAALTSLVIERIRRVEAGSPEALDTRSAMTFKLPAVAMAGSILKQVIRVRRAFGASLRRRYPEIEVLGSLVNPTAGALWHARYCPPTVARSVTAVLTSPSL